MAASSVSAHGGEGVGAAVQNPHEASHALGNAHVEQSCVSQTPVIAERVEHVLAATESIVVSSVSTHAPFATPSDAVNASKVKIFMVTVRGEPL